jgi:hypothetical protein
MNKKQRELYSFYKYDVIPVKVIIGESLITSKDAINVFGFLFDTKLSWSQHISN